MTLSLDRFHLFARLVGALLSLMGLGLFAVFGIFFVSGTNVLGPDLPLNAPGMVILASVGAFQLPLGLSLLGRDSRTSFRLRVAAGAMAAMALIRLLAYAQPEMRAIVGATPLIEGAMFSGIAALALIIRPEHEAPIEIMREFDVAVPAEQAWDLIATRFGDVASFASGVRAATMDGPVDVGCVRTCQSEPFGPFKSAAITEELVEFDNKAMRYTYTAGGELPAFIPASKNRWSVIPVGPGRCRVRSHSSIELTAWAVPFAPLLGWFIAGAVDQFGADVQKHFAGPSTALGTAATAH